MEGFRSIPNYGERKLNSQFNLDYVEFCTDACVNGKFDSFKLNQDQKDCLVNCYTKVGKLNSYVTNQYNSFVAKK